MQTAPPGFLKTECRWQCLLGGLNKHFLAGKFWQISVVDQFGYIFPITPELASQCGYTIAVDHRNVEFRASVLSCYVHNLNDEQFSITIQIKVSGTDTGASTYIQMLSCMYSPWAVREIYCEENYMQVSVQRNIPTIEDYAQDAEDWALVFPEATYAESGIWQVVFHIPGGKRSMTVKEAQRMNYGINTTMSRILLRAPYHTNEAQIVVVQGIPLTVIRSTSFYKEQWMVLLIDTAIACPVDGITFTDDIITWTVPRIFTPIVPGAVHQDNTSMGVNGIKLNPTQMAERNYTLDKNVTALAINVPIGAQDGYFKSHVVNGRYGIKYSINLFLEHQWEDEAWGLNKINVIHPVTTPFIPQPLVLIDDTIPEQWLFNITLGNFLPDVELQKLTLDSQSFPVDEENQMFNVYNGTNPNETTLNRIFILEVPMESPVVDRKYIGDGVEQYTLDIIYTLTVVPENLIFTYVAHLIHEHKIVLPEANGFCNEENMTLIVTQTLDRYWIPFIGTIQLTPQSAEQRGYTLIENGTHSVIIIPQDATGAVLEAINNQGLRSRFDIQFRDNKALDVLVNFSVSCSFSVTSLLTCFPNGRIVITALKLEALLGIDGKMMLKDKACKPKESTEFKATFEFSADTCGTSRRFEKDYMIYENEVAYFRKSAPRHGPIYRLAISCHYHVNDSLHIPFEHQVNPQPTVAAGYGPLVLVLQLAKEVSYSNLYEDNDYPVLKYLTEPLYFEVQLLHNEDPQIELFLQDCWATASQDRHGIPQWPIVINSCESEADVHKTIFHPVTRNERVRYPTHFKRFEVKMFAFILANFDTLEQLYFHCSVVLCRKEPVNGLLCPGQCVPGKQRIGRSADAEHHQQRYVSSGAVVILAEFPTIENWIMKDRQVKSYWPLILIGGSAIIASIVLGMFLITNTK
ncbi:zona pellucida sperm-binding protein 2-like [Scyliorhinus canicula]|uniref:zona pellucida sperm-binding protein 2-like n=1 Tax=Scyliorhinus canicula TaxID=7830 RepID=UPI0018F61F7B|nr:zona pellucida sperm-binding protein 2-like [Scyliorhinus canicula]